MTGRFSTDRRSNTPLNAFFRPTLKMWRTFPMTRPRVPLGHLSMEGRSERMDQAISDYWRRNVRLKLILLSIWAFVSIVMSILMINVLNEASIGGFPLGFWMAQQGSIFVFVILIFVYAKTMDRYDTELEATLQGIAGGNA